jgi:asparagine synthase (glutamine-hydrolysing)
MTGCDGRYQVTFNGEIYNFRALAADLATRGYRFNPNSDTAILAPLYDAYGEAMLDKLNGIFAFAIWDREERHLFLARDRFGVKPLYYCQTPAGFYFASETKALFAAPGLVLDVDTKGARDYLVHLWSPSERTLFSAIRKLRPGQSARIEGGAQTPTLTLNTWNEPPVGGRDTNAAETTPAALATLFDQVVADQCISDAPVGAFLSGGVDSTAIVSAMIRTGHKPRQTYCVAFADTGMKADGFEDDIAYAQMAAEKLGATLTPIVTHAPSLDQFRDLATTLDEPQADPAPLFVEAISAAARTDGVKVLMSGLGGDDVFSGYRRHRVAAIRERTRLLRALFGFAPAPRLAGVATIRRASRLMRLLAGSDDDFLLRAFEFQAPDIAESVLSPPARQAVNGVTANDLTRAIQKSAGYPVLSRLLHLERFGFVPDHNLNYTDKAAMKFGVEVRVPFLDPRLTAFARRIAPGRMAGAFDAKMVLKQAMRDRLPEAVLSRPKTGFGGPVRQWVIGPMHQSLCDLFASSAFRSNPLFDPEGVDAIQRKTRSGAFDGAYLLLAIAMIQFCLDDAKRQVGGKSS